MTFPPPPAQGAPADGGGPDRTKQILAAVGLGAAIVAAVILAATALVVSSRDERQRATANEPRRTAAPRTDTPSSTTTTTTVTTTTTAATTSPSTTTAAAPPATSTTTLPPTTTTSPPVEQGKGPVGATSVGVWWSPGADQFSASNLWVFDPVTEAVPYGTRTGYQPAGVGPPVATQFAFTYQGGGGDHVLSYPSGTVQNLSVTGYNAASDTLSVVWEGYSETWYGCSSGQMPALALAACR